MDTFMAEYSVAHAGLDGADDIGVTDAGGDEFDKQFAGPRIADSEFLPAEVRGGRVGGRLVGDDGAGGVDGTAGDTTAAIQATVSRR